MWFSDIKASKASRRIKPTLVSLTSADEAKCYSAFNSVPIVPAPADAMPRSVWAKPRHAHQRFITSCLVTSALIPHLSLYL